MQLCNHRSFLTVLASALTKDKCNAKTIVVDIGVNVGWFSTILVMAGCDVVGFEPQKAPLTHACRVVARNGQLGRYTTINAALANKAGTAHQQGGYGPGNAVSFEAAGGTGGLKTYRLRDKIASDIVFLKVDVEGAEIIVLDTIVDYVQNTAYGIEHILIEYGPERWKFYLTEGQEAIATRAVAQLTALVEAGYTVYDCRWDITEQQHAKKYAPDWKDGDMADTRFSDSLIWDNADQVAMHTLSCRMHVALWHFLVRGEWSCLWESGACPRPALISTSQSWPCACWLESNW